jgi:hypothetical protein
MDARAQVTAPAGLTSAEAAARRRAGEANTPVTGTSRSYAAILRTNVFSFYNSILFVIGAALLAMGRYDDAFVSVGLGLVNAVISAAQEIGAKRKLDRLQLLGTAPVVVVRDGAGALGDDGGRDPRRGHRTEPPQRCSPNWNAPTPTRHDVPAQGSTPSRAFRRTARSSDRFRPRRRSSEKSWATRPPGSGRRRRSPSPPGPPPP